LSYGKNTLRINIRFGMLVGQQGGKMKICIKCKLEKEHDQFSVEKQKKDGFCSYCKECLSLLRIERKKNISEEKKNELAKYAENYRIQNREVLREKGKIRFHSDVEKGRRRIRESYYRHKEEIAKRRKVKRSNDFAREKENARQKEWRNKNPMLFRSYVKKWQQTNRVRHNAHQKVHRAVDAGILIRSEFCQQCEVRCKTEGHHEDYSKSLDVIWLCRKCHARKNETVEV
jgi:hypothetical protein